MSCAECYRKTSVGTYSTAYYTEGSPTYSTQYEKLDEKHRPIETIAEPHLLRKMSKDSIYALGGHFALLCQFAHPALAEGSYKQINFANRVLEKLKTTNRFLNAAVHGTREEKEAIFGVICAAHSDIREDNFYPNDPELHKWTAATFFVSLIVVHEAFFEKVPRETQEQLYMEAAIYATSLRMPAEMWPDTLDEFWIYWHHNINTLTVTDRARRLCRDLMYPRKMPLWFHPTAPVLRVLTTHWLPEKLQREYNMEPTPSNTFLYHQIVGLTALTWPCLPKMLRAAPSKHGVNDMKKTAKGIEESGTWFKSKNTYK